ncbi:hypothetical protein EDD85DRAFT_945978 [Armillaria nabsnona]|nr:hypothetical protein EDD85DRAFT_945978 [Armillaria nabsnona]
MGNVSVVLLKVSGGYLDLMRRLIQALDSERQSHILRRMGPRRGTRDVSAQRHPAPNSATLARCHWTYSWRNVCIQIIIHHMHHLESVSHFPVLQTIELDIFDDDDYLSDMSSEMCLRAPQLWQASRQSQGIYQVRLPSGITHYSGCITCAEDLQFLSQLPKLRTCHLRSNETSPTDAAPVVMAELRQLYVEDSDTLNLLTAPMLQSLTIVEVVDTGRQNGLTDQLDDFFYLPADSASDATAGTEDGDPPASTDDGDVTSSQPVTQLVQAVHPGNDAEASGANIAMSSSKKT